MYLEIPRKAPNAPKTAWQPRDLRTANQKLNKQFFLQLPGVSVESYKNHLLTQSQLQYKHNPLPNLVMPRHVTPCLQFYPLKTPCTVSYGPSSLIHCVGV